MLWTDGLISRTPGTGQRTRCPLPPHFRRMFFHPLDSALSSGVRVRALRVLCDARRPLSGREVARLAHTGKSMTLRILAEFADLGIVRREQAASQHLYQINEENELVKGGIIPLFQTERRRVELVFSELREVLRSVGGTGAAVLTAYLFGSAARGDDAPGSDFDVLVVTADSASAEEVHDALAARTSAFRTRYGLDLSPVVLDCASASSQAEADSFLRDALREGRRIYGTPLEEVLDGCRRKPEAD